MVMLASEKAGIRVLSLWFIFAGVLFLSSLPSLVGAAHNITVDDTDTTQIAYVPPGSWKETPFDPLNAGGTHKVTSKADATATFTFTGTAIYFYSPLWPFQVTTQISLDGAGPVVLDLMDPDTVVPIPDGAETVESSVAWFADGLLNVPHTFVVSVAPGAEHAIVDAFVYTVPDAGDPTTSAVDAGSSSTSAAATSSSSTTSFLPRPTTSATSTATSSSSPTAKKGLSIALGIVCTVFALLVLYGVYWYWRRRQRLLLEQQEEEEYRRNNPSTAEDNSSSSSPTMGYAYKREPSTWQRNARGRLIAAPTGITTMIPTVEQGGNMNLGHSVGVGSSSSRGPRKGPRRHGPSPLSMSMSTPTSTSSGSSSSSSSSGSPRMKGKKPLTTIPEMRMREDDALSPSSAASASSNQAEGSNSPFADANGLSPRVGAGSTKWTTFDQNGS